MNAYQVNGKKLSALGIKAELLVDGVNIDASALDGVGEKYKEQIHGVFDFDFESHEHQKLPAELIIGDGMLVPFKKNSASPFIVKRNNGSLFLEHNGRYVIDVRYSDRPRFYNQKTSDSILMSRIGQNVSKDALIVAYSNYCNYYKTGEECWFCNLVHTKKTYNGDVIGLKTPEHIGETFQAAIEEGVVDKLLLTGGMHPNGKEHEYYIEVAKEVKEHTGKDHVPGTVVISAPTDLKKIEKLKKAGFDSVAFNLEVWDRNLFAGICPGKARTIGWENYRKALEYAGRIFEHGKVRSMFVSGLESKDSFLKGAEYLASKNVLAFPMPWTPNPGSKLEGHRTPQPFWHLELSRKLVDIWLHYGYTIEHLKELPLSRNYLYFDEMAGGV